MKILDIKNNKLVDNFEDVESKVSSGEYTFEKGDVEVISPDGQKGTIPSQNAAKAFQEGYKFYSPTLKKQDELKKEYGEGVGAELAAGGLGAARGLTFGLSDQALSKLNLIKPEALKAYRDLNPTSSLVGEIAGTVAPVLLSGGTGLVAKGAAKALPSLAMDAGIGAAKLTGAGLKGKIASKTVSKIVENAAKAGVGSAVEGALYGSGQLISEDALGDAEFNAENLLAYAGEGALLGGVTGGSIPIIGAGAKAFGTRVRSLLGKSFKGDTLNSLVNTAEISRDLSRASVDNITNEKISNAIKEKFKRAGREDFAENGIGAASDNWMFRMNESSLRKQPTIFGNKVREKYDVLYDELNKDAKNLIGNVDLDKAASDYASDIKAKTLSKLDSLEAQSKSYYEKLGDKLSDIPVNSDDFKDVIDSLKSKKYIGLFNTNKYFDQLADAASNVTNLDELKQLRTVYGKTLKNRFGSEDYQIIQDIYSSLTDKRDSLIKETAKSIGGDVSKNLSKADDFYKEINKQSMEVGEALGLKNKGYRDFKEKISKIDDYKLRNKILSQSDKSKLDKIKAFSPDAYEDARSSKLRDLFYKSLDGQSEFNGKKFVNNVLKDEKHKYLMFGDQSTEEISLLADIFNKIPAPINPSDTNTAEQFLNLFNVVTHAQSWLQYSMYTKGEKGINKYLNETLDVFKNIESRTNQSKIKISESVGDFITKTRQLPTVATLNAGESRNYDDAIKYLSDFENDPDGTIEKITEKNKIIFDNAPKTSEALSGKTMQIFQFLKEKMPKSYEGVGYFNNYQPSKSEKMKFMKYYTYANKPTQILDDLKNGFVKPEAVETVRALYPRMYEEIYNEIISRVAEVKDLPYKKKRSLYNMLSIIGASSMIPKNLRMLQGSMQQAQEEVTTNKNKNELRVTGLKNIDQADRFKTKLDKLA